MPIPTNFPTNYSEHTSFSNDNWNGWAIIEPRHSMKFIHEAQNTYVGVNISPPPLPLPDHYKGTLLIHKQITDFIAGECYTISLRAKRLSNTVKRPQLSWYIDSTFKSSLNFEQKKNEWQHFVIPFKATQSTHVLTLGSDHGVEFALDDIRIYPHVLRIDFEDETAVTLRPGEEHPLRHFTLRNVSSKNGAITGIRRVDITKPGKAQGMALILAQSQSSDDQIVQLDLNGEYHSIEFAWTQLDFPATVSFFTSNGKPIKELTYGGPGKDKDFEVKFTSPEPTPIARVQFNIKDNTYIDFITLKTLNC
ncbi:hypothetical protein [Pseudomonas sp. NPDC012596]|uniref:hypothetical protein n=1 Tax=Pseudomonas sp. NPDC012596 TaxID=3364419 RepID=UPI0036A008F5